MKALLAAAALAFTLAGPAFAFQCPADMAKIDAALQTAQLTDEQKARVMELRTQGEQQHQAGQHQQSMETLGEAKEQGDPNGFLPEMATRIAAVCRSVRSHERHTPPSPRTFASACDRSTPRY